MWLCITLRSSLQTFGHKPPRIESREKIWVVKDETPGRTLRHCLAILLSTWMKYFLIKMVSLSF